MFDHETVIDHQMLVPLQGGDMVADYVRELLRSTVCWTVDADGELQDQYDHR